MTRAFDAVDELKIKIEQLLKHNHKSLSSQCREILKLIHKQLHSFEDIVKVSLLSDLDTPIWEEANELEGIVDRIGHFSEEEEEEEDDSDDDDDGDEEEEEDDDDSDDDDDDDIDEDDDEEVEDGDGVQFSMEEVEKLKRRIRSFAARLKKLKKRCVDVLYNCLPDDEEEEEEKDGDSDDVTSKMIGVRDVYEELKEKLMSEQLCSLVGMPGIGKSTVVDKIFQDPTVVECFDHRVWIRVGKKCQLKDIPRRILAEIDPDSLKKFPGADEEAVHKYLKASLKREKYLIVLDDVWDRYISYLWHPFYRYEINKLDHPFLHPESESRILVTSRLQLPNENDAGIINNDSIVQMRLLNREESWDLLRDKVFCKGSSCPPQLEKAGKKIAENCEGLPLTIVAVARRLSEEETSTPEYWNEVAAKKNHQLFMDVYDEISKVLLPSYTFLPPLLRMCFLYIGLFVQGYKIPRPKLINLWLADRFRELNVELDTDDDANACLEELVSNSLVMVYEKSTFNMSHTVKTCGLHSSLWHLSYKKAKETKFALVLSSPGDCLEDDMKGQHRLSIHSNVLFAMKDVHKSVEDNCVSDAHSLLCFGPYHQYQVPLCFRLKLLRELDALSIRFYEFPTEVTQLVQLTYLSLTSNGMIPASISQLKLLEFFIVDRHQSIKSCKDAPYLPAEIWSLSNLKHLQVMGSDLPDPHGASLDSLTTLSNVSARSCTKAILKGVPVLKELTIRIELTPHDDGNSSSCFAHISHIHLLYKLKCVIVNPTVVPPVVLFSSLRGEYLRKLCLSGMGYPWKEMSRIASLPNLAVLKLKKYAFQGPTWEVGKTGFTKLNSLVIEDTDLVDWKIGRGLFKDFFSLKMKSCYKLKNIHGKFGEHLKIVELVDCNPACVAKMKKAIPKEATIYIHSSWEDGKLKK